MTCFLKFFAFPRSCITLIIRQHYPMDEYMYENTNIFPAATSHIARAALP